MKTYMVVKTETLQKMYDSFAGVEEYTDFIMDLMSLSGEISFANEFNRRTEPTDLQVGVNMAKMLLSFSLFCRGNIEVIKELIRLVEYEVVQEEDGK